MRVSVKLFASLRERTGQEHIYLDLDEGATVADAWTALCSLDSEFQACRDRVLPALNRRYADFRAVLSEGDELALFPPVSGGE